MDDLLLGHGDGHVVAVVGGLNGLLPRVDILLLLHFSIPLR